MSEGNEFKAAGLTMPSLTVGYGLFLVAWGSLFHRERVDHVMDPIVYGCPNPDLGAFSQSRCPPNENSGCISQCSLGSYAQSAVTRFFSGFGKDGGPFANPKAASSQLMLLITGGLFTLACVSSRLYGRVRTNPAR